MTEILEILKCLSEIISKSQLNNLSVIISAMLSMTGSKTMLNISRWTKEELSYRSIQRFFSSEIDWLNLSVKLFLINIFVGQKFILAVDETIVTKSGKSTYGIDYFFNSIYQKVMKSLCFSCISIIDVNKLKSYPLFSSQLVFTEEEKLEAKTKKEKIKQSKGNKRGRKKGSKNNVKEKKLSSSFRLLKEQLEKCVSVLNKLSISHLVADGFYGNITVIDICKSFELFLVSKLQSNSALYYKYDKEYSGRGRKRIYGDRVDIKNLPFQYLISNEVKDDVNTSIYQISCLHKQFKKEINVVIVTKENVKTKKIARVIFFSTDLTLSSTEIIQYYSSRFQIEFNFRDAKEFFGLEDFMNTKETNVKNAVNLSFFMVLISQILLKKFRDKSNNQSLSIRDLISHQTAEKYIFETFKLFKKFNPQIFIPYSFESITSIGRINL